MNDLQWIKSINILQGELFDIILLELTPQSRRSQVLETVGRPGLVEQRRMKVFLLVSVVETIEIIQTIDVWLFGLVAGHKPLSDCYYILGLYGSWMTNQNPVRRLVLNCTQEFTWKPAHSKIGISHSDNM